MKRSLDQSIAGAPGEINPIRYGSSDPEVKGPLGEDVYSHHSHHNNDDLNPHQQPMSDRPSEPYLGNEDADINYYYNNHTDGGVDHYPNANATYAGRRDDNNPEDFIYNDDEGDGYGYGSSGGEGGEGEGGGGGYVNGEWTFEDGLHSVEIATTLQTKSALIATDAALYAYRAAATETSADVGDKMAVDADAKEDDIMTKKEDKDDDDDGEPGFEPFDYDRYYQGVGYEAHRDEVDEEEIASWHSKFQYLRIDGVGIKAPDGEEVIDYIDMIETEPLPATAQDTAASTTAAEYPVENESELYIVGKKAVIYPTTVLNPDEISLRFDGTSAGTDQAGGEEEEQEEICIVDGILEEFIEVDRTGDMTPEQLGDFNRSDDDAIMTCLEPEASMREEVISSLIDVLWPDIVEALTPLIERMMVLPIEEWRARALEQAAMKKKPANDWGSDDGW